MYIYIEYYIKIKEWSNIFVCYEKNKRIFVEVGSKLKIKLFHLYITVFTKLYREEINISGSDWVIRRR